MLGRSSRRIESSTGVAFALAAAIVVVASILIGWASPANAQQSLRMADRLRQPLTQFPEPVLAMLSKYKLSANNLSVYVQDVEQSAPLLTVNAQLPRNPASVMKLMTTVVALHELVAAVVPHGQSLDLHNPQQKTPS